MKSTADPHAPLRVLLLEDSAFDAELLTEALREIYPKASIDVVANEAHYHRALVQTAPDVILSDYELPGFSGTQALSLASQLVPRVPFIFVSGIIGEDNAVELLKRGATDYVAKGRLGRLPQVLERALREAAERNARQTVEVQLDKVHRDFSVVDNQRLALINLSDRIRDLDDPVEIAYAAAETLAHELKVDRAGYGIVNKLAETIDIAKDWNAPGVNSLAGRLRFRDYGSYIEDLAQGRTVAFEDARTDPRTKDTAAALERINARAVVNMPLTEKGNLVGLLYLNHGSVRAWTDTEIGFVREVGDRVRSSIARREAQAELQLLARSLESQVQQRTYERDRTWALNQDLLGVASVDGHFESINPAWQAVLGWQEAEVRAAPLRTLVHPEDLDATDAAMAALKNGAKTTHFENRCRTTLGDYRWLSWTAVRDDGHVYTVARDITSEKVHAAELDAAKEQLRQSQKLEAVGQLTGGLAHDFNNLLGAIKGCLELIRRRNKEGRAQDIDRYVELAQGATARGAALTHRLLAFSRQQTLDPKPLDMNRLVAGMQELIARTMGPGITMEVVGAAGLWTVEADPNQLENALLNLCINARDAMPDGGKLSIETGNRWLDERTARERDVSPGQYVSLCVSDNGVGMPPEVVARAFDPFYTTKPLGQGTGLGLSMVYGFSKQSGGQVRIYSEVGKGTMVCIYLPRHAGEEEAAAKPDAVQEAMPAQHGRTVLVVDDEASLRMLLVEELREAGYRVLEAGDGAEALQLLQTAGRVDMLVTDVGLPGGMNGRQVAEAARLARPGLQVLFITGYAENAVLSHGHLDIGMHVLTKPFELSVLVRRAKEMLADSPGP
ncbi:two-component system sensor histidine kinase/response regulator [Rhodoferax koreense]|uniref:histidine kinase n=1 Tax=Rhodoferax koreensis TaxID=1842727 RepID=A0A1P8K0X6_9BURK|nr:response regulator [Rhodoferax koreense]APW39652.1 two-component system sensor histidine kinase/response regulator [Rhodoferax koreense]